MFAAAAEVSQTEIFEWMVASDANPKEIVVAISISRLSGIAKRVTIIPNHMIGIALTVKPTNAIALDLKIHPVINPIINNAESNELASNIVWLYFALPSSVSLSTK